MIRHACTLLWVLTLIACRPAPETPKRDAPPGPPVLSSSGEGARTQPPLSIPGRPGSITGPLAPWAFFPFSPSAPSEATIPALELPRRTCTHAPASGALLRVGATVEVFRSEVETMALRLGFLAPADLQQLGQSAPIGTWGEVSAIAAFGTDGALFADVGGQLYAASSGHVAVLTSPSSAGGGWEVDRIWTQGDVALVARSRDSRAGVWEAWSSKNRVSIPLATGGVGRCGQPLVGGRALAVVGRKLVLLDLAARLAPEVALESPLDENSCVAGDGVVTAVTGFLAHVPTLALHDASGWQIVPLPPSGEVFEPLVHGQHVVVAAPRASVRIADGSVVPEAGVVHVVARSGHTWALREHLISLAPSSRGLFGFSVGLSDAGLYTSEMAAGMTRNPAGKITALGRPQTCRVPWAP